MERKVLMGKSVNGAAKSLATPLTDIVKIKLVVYVVEKVAERLNEEESAESDISFDGHRLSGLESFGLGFNVWA